MKSLHFSKVIFCVVFITFVSAPALAKVWHVPGEAITIQEGIYLAVAGDVVELSCGDYYENNIEMKEGVTLRAAPGDEGCVTLYGQGGVGIWFYEMDSCTVKGLNFVGFGSSAIRLVHASPLIEDCHFEDNSFTDGGAIQMLGSSPTILNCTFINNTSTHAGGAIAMGDCNTLIVGSSFHGNVSNYGGAIDVESGSELEMVDCIVTENTAHFRGGGLLVWENIAYSQVAVFSSTVMNNQANEGDDGWVNPGCTLTLTGSTLGPDFDINFDGPGQIINDSVVVAEPRSFGGVKAMFR